MLTDLSVKGLGVIREVDLSLRAGGIALTGETGAGKTLVVTALSLLLGDRASRDVVRTGVRRAEVQARFEVARDHPAAALVMGLDDAEMPPEDVIEIVLARWVTADGKSTARVNGRMVPLTTLRRVADELVEIAGQNEHQVLTRSSVHADVLDDFSGRRAQEVRRELKTVLAAAAATKKKLHEATSAEQARLRDADVLDYEIAEIESAAPQEGEVERLRQEITRLENAEQITAALDAVATALRGEGAAAELVAAATKEMRGVAALDESAAALIERLGSVAVELDDIGAEVTSLAPERDPGALDDIRDRLDVLARLERKYGDARSYLETARTRRAALDLADLEIEAMSRALDSYGETAGALASELTRLRAEAAPVLEERVSGWLDELALGGGRLEVALVPRPISDHGAEDVELKFSPSPGERTRPIGQVASGGELARLALALHLVTGDHAPEPGKDLPSPVSGKTMLFDEVDAGVGGKAAQAVARALAGLAARGQVVVVTHLPQVAAYADQHLRVEKTETELGPVAEVEEVRDEARVAELSRMLAGLPDSERARGHARELLEMTGVLGT